MATDVPALMAAMKTAVEAVTGVNRAVLSEPGIVQRLLHDVLWPTALVSEGSGAADPVNGKLWVQEFFVSVIDVSDLDVAGEGVTKRVSGIGKLIVDALEYNEADAIYIAVDGSSEPSDVDTGGQLLVVQTWRFEAEIRRP